MSERILVIGPGAIGGAVAGALVECGHEVLIAARTPIDELEVNYPGGAVRAPAMCLDAPPPTIDVAAVVLAVKAYQTPDAALWIEGGTQAGAPLFVLQNGVEQVETAAPFVSSDSPVIGTVVNLPAHRSGPGKINVKGPAALTVPTVDGSDTLVRLLAESFISVRAVENWQTFAWIKLMMNAAMGGVGTLTRRDNRVFHDAEARRLAVGLMEEVAAVGRAEGAEIPADLPSQMIERVQAAAGGHASSIVVDRRSGNPTEWDVRNAAVGRFARKHGIDVPLNDLVTTLVRLGEPEAGGD